MRAPSCPPQLGVTCSTHPRQLFARQPIDNSSATETGRHLHKLVIVSYRLSNISCIAPERMRLHGCKHSIGRIRRDDRNELALVSDMDRIKPKEFAGRRNRRLHRNGGFLQTEAEARLMRNLVERGGKAATRGVTHHPDTAATGRNHGGYEVVQRG